MSHSGNKKRGGFVKPRAQSWIKKCINGVLGWYRQRGIVYPTRLDWEPATRLQKGTSFSPSIPSPSPLFSPHALLIVTETISQWRPPQHQQQPWHVCPSHSDGVQYNPPHNRLDLDLDLDLDLSPGLFFNPVDLLPSSTAATPFSFPDLSTTCPPVDDPLFYDSLQPPFYTGLPPLPSLSDSDYQDLTGFPEFIDNTVTDIDWTALGCLPASGLGESPNVLETPSVESPDLPPEPLTSSTTSLSMSTATPLPAPSPTARDENPKAKEPPSRVSKRQLNTLAARRYRQRRVDRMNELEAELEAIKRERDELKMRVSKLEGETDALKSMLKDKSK